MRYKFRGKRLDNGEWVVGDLLHDRGFGGDVISDVVWIRNENNKSYQALPESVGQWTGLVDKNGKEIYEGDILENTLGWVFEVRWDNENGRFLGHQSKPRGDTYICYVSREPKATIIGNIHDNPELMEVE